MGNYSLQRAFKGFMKGMHRAFIVCAAAMVAYLAVLGQPVFAETVAVDQIGGFKSPTRLVLSSSGSIYVADHKKGSVVILDNGGKKIGALSDLGAPLGLAVHETPETFICTKFKGNSGKCKEGFIEPAKTFLYAGDEGDGSVHVYLNGEQKGVLGSGAGEFAKPNGIAVTSELTVYVVDSVMNQVRIYDSSGSLLTVFGGSGLDFPTDIALNETAGELYVSDFNNKRIRVYNLNGGWLRDISAPPNSSGDPVFYRPVGLGIDAEGNLYVVDNALACVAKISNQGVLLETIGYRNGQYWTGELAVPIDAAAAGNKIFVTSNGQRQLRIFEVVP